MQRFLNARTIVLLAMIFVGSLCVFMSARNTSGYLLLTGMDRHIAIMTGAALITFSATAFTSMQLFLSSPGPAKLFVVLFLFVGVAVISFSILATLSLNYYHFVQSDAVQADIQARINQRRAELMAEAREESVHTGQWIMTNMERFISLAEQSGESWRLSMQTVMEAGQVLSEIETPIVDEYIYVPTIPMTFFAFMLALPELDIKYIFDFAMLVLPAVFYDLLAPLSITVVLFLMGISRKQPDIPLPTVASTPEEIPPTKKAIRRARINRQPDLFWQERA